MDHKNSQSASYAAAGVDITAGYRAVELMKKHVARTRNEGCLDDVGGFGGCFGLPVAGMEEPVLVSGTDGCGTKVKLAILMDKHDTIGIDAVAMCVNDIICVGAKPLFFLDYIACGKNIPEKIAEIVSGVAEGCVQSGAALIGGETAEHPGLMPVEDYDLAGFAVGIVDKKKIIDKERMAVGDVVIALASTGIHSNGFSLCRKVFDIDNNNPELYVAREELGDKTIAEIVSGVAEGCVQSGAALIGGETAEHPGMMPVEDYDLAGFAVGIVDKKKILDNTRMAEGDVVIALPSTGIHSNGFSLCRKVFDIDNNNPELYVAREELGGKTIAEALLVPTKIYVKPVLALLEKVDVKGISHITGGGFYENIPRSIPNGLCAKIDKSAVKVLPIFDMIAKWGNIPERDMYNTYNMGVGMSIVVPAEEVELSLNILKDNGIDAYVIGQIIAHDTEKVIL